MVAVADAPTPEIAEFMREVFSALDDPYDAMESAAKVRMVKDFIRECERVGADPFELVTNGNGKARNGHD